MRLFRWQRTLMVLVPLLIIVAVFSFTFITRPHSAHAAWNGQEINFSCASMDTVIISGDNQNWQYVTWYGYNVNGDAVTWNWWWQGNVHFHYHTWSGWHDQITSIPTVWLSGNIYYVGCYSS